jgi:hypothetical protein
MPHPHSTSIQDYLQALTPEHEKRKWHCGSLLTVECVNHANPSLSLARSITNLIQVIPHFHIISDTKSIFHKHPIWPPSPHTGKQEAVMALWKSTHYRIMCEPCKTFTIVSTINHKPDTGNPTFPHHLRCHILTPWASKTTSKPSHRKTRIDEFLWWNTVLLDQQFNTLLTSQITPTIW